MGGDHEEDLGMLEQGRNRVDHAKKMVLDCRATEKDAQAALRQAKELKKRKRKGGSTEAVKAAEAAVGEARARTIKADSVLKKIEAEALELEEKLRDEHSPVQQESTVRDTERAQEPQVAEKLPVAAGILTEKETAVDSIAENVAENAVADAHIAGEVKPGPDNANSENAEMKLITKDDEAALATEVANRKRKSSNAEVIEIESSGDKDDGNDAKPKKKRGKTENGDNADHHIKSVYIAATAEEKRAMRDKASSQIRKFLRNPSKKVDCKFRRLIREVSEFCPNAATTTRGLALHCLETNRGNLICPYHGERGKDGKVNDESVTENSSYQVTGTPYARAVKGHREDVIVRRAGHLHCGCPEDAVLLDFFLWKDTAITSPVNDITEGWKDQRLDPRARLLISAAWVHWSGLTVDEMYRGNHGFLEAEVERLGMQVEMLQEALADAKEKVNRRKNRRAAANYTSSDTD